jgi:acetyl-CoA synthetase
VAQANIKDPKIYEEATAAGAKFWEGPASELHWFRKWDKVLDWKPPYAKWFAGGQINISYNCLDVNIAKGLRNKAAIVPGRHGHAFPLRMPIFSPNSTSTFFFY